LGVREKGIGWVPRSVALVSVPSSGGEDERERKNGGAG